MSTLAVILESTGGTILCVAVLVAATTIPIASCHCQVQVEAIKAGLVEKRLDGGTVGWGTP